MESRVSVVSQHTHTTGTVGSMREKRLGLMSEIDGLPRYLVKRTWVGDYRIAGLVPRSVGQFEVY